MPRLSLVAGAGHQPPFEQLAHDSVGKVLLELAAAGAQELKAAPVSLVAARLQQAALAHARRRLDEHERAISPRPALGGRGDDLELTLALEEPSQARVQRTRTYRAEASKRSAGARPRARAGATPRPSGRIWVMMRIRKGCEEGPVSKASVDEAVRER